MPKDTRKISQMRNLGPTAEDDFHAAGIVTAHQLKELGTEKAFHKMIEGRLRRGKDLTCINANYLYAIYGAIHNLDWRLIPQDKKEMFKEMTKKIRETEFT